MAVSSIGLILVSRRLTVDVALQRSQLIEGACPQRLQLVDSAGEQLGQGVCGP